jgi:hypothetical protein
MSVESWKDVFWMLTGLCLLAGLILSLMFGLIFLFNHQTTHALVSLAIFLSIFIFFIYIYGSVAG